MTQKINSRDVFCRGIQELKSKIKINETISVEYGFFVNDVCEFLVVALEYENGIRDNCYISADVRNIVADAVYFNEEDVALILNKVFENDELLGNRKGMLDEVFWLIENDIISSKTLYLFPFYIDSINGILSEDYLDNSFVESFNDKIDKAKKTGLLVNWVLESTDYSLLNSTVRVAFNEYSTVPHILVDNYNDFITAIFSKTVEKSYRFRLCRNCKKWFCNGLNTHKVYCNRMSSSTNRTCSAEGIGKTYSGKNDDNTIKATYAKLYPKYRMQMNRGKISFEEFSNWSSVAKRIKYDYLNAKISEEEALEWFKNNIP